MGDIKADGTLYVKVDGGNYTPLGKVVSMAWTDGRFNYEMIREEKDDKSREH